MGTADGAAEEHGSRRLAQVGQELLKLAFVAPAVEAHVGPQLGQSIRTRGQLGVPDLTHEGGRGLAVDQPVGILPGVEARGAAGDLMQDVLADTIEPNGVGKLPFEPFSRASISDTPWAETSADLAGRIERR